LFIENLLAGMQHSFSFFKSRNQYLHYYVNRKYQFFIGFAYLFYGIIASKKSAKQTDATLE
jgi:hypothetical protein